MTENEIGTIIIGAAIEVHKKLGPGLLESVYEKVLCHLLTQQGLNVKNQIPVPINFDGIKFDEGFRADLLVEDKVLVELKSVERVANVYKKQLLTYLRLSGFKLGYLINFNEEILKNGITRTINGKL